MLDGKSLPEYETVYHTTMYGGYNRGVTIPVQREGPFPPEDELGDNYQLGVRSTGIKGVTLDMAGFFKNIENYQIKGAATTVSGQNTFTSADEVQISGFEMYGRFDTRPFTGWDLNPFAEATFTYSNGEITAGVGDTVVSDAHPATTSRARSSRAKHDRAVFLDLSILTSLLVLLRHAYRLMHVRYYFL